MVKNRADIHGIDKYILSSFSHDLKEPIRSVRRYLHKIAACTEDKCLKASALNVDKIAVEFGESVKKARARLAHKMTAGDFSKLLNGSLRQELANLYSETKKLAAENRSVVSKFHQADFNVLDVRLNRLQTRYNSLLDYVEANGKLKYSRFGLHNEIRRVWRDLDSLVRKKNGQFIAKKIKPTLIDADQAKVSQVIQNVLQNALKYGSRSGSVRVSISAFPVSPSEFSDDMKLRLPHTNVPHFAYVAIDDGGHGVEQEKSESLFRMFTRGRHSDQDGTGAGLAIVRSIVQAHEGVVWIRSLPERGFSVRMLLPKQPLRTQ